MNIQTQYRTIYFLFFISNYFHEIHQWWMTLVLSKSWIILKRIVRAWAGLLAIFQCFNNLTEKAKYLEWISPHLWWIPRHLSFHTALSQELAMCHRGVMIKRSLDSILPGGLAFFSQYDVSINVRLMRSMIKRLSLYRNRHTSRKLYVMVRFLQKLSANSGYMSSTSSRSSLNESF